MSNERQWPVSLSKLQLIVEQLDDTLVYLYVYVTWFLNHSLDLCNINRRAVNVLFLLIFSEYTKLAFLH